MKKPTGLSMNDVLGRIGGSGRFDCKFLADVESESGDVHTHEIRWAMSLRSPKPHNWQMSLLLHNIRFDCIDHEWTVTDHRGHQCTGWHRHIWDPTNENCDFKKECLDDFGSHRTIQEFVRDGCSLMGLMLDEEGESGGTGYLQFD
jgi:hypothetical protein